MNAVGQVVDAETGIPLPAATIGVYTQPHCGVAPCPPILIGGTITDDNGFFQIITLNGTHVEISMIGYRTNIPLLQDDVSKQILMERANYQQDEATVTAKQTYYEAALIGALFIFCIVSIMYIMTRK